MSRPGRPDMHDPADTDVHSPKGKPPYPQPAKSKVKPHDDDAGGPGAGDDLADPGEANPNAPHDRGVERDGHYEDAVDDMNRKISKDEAERRREQKDR